MTILRWCADGLYAIHIGTESVSASSQGKVVWQGEVEVFTVSLHPQARICYAWSYQDGPVERFAAILGIRRYARSWMPFS